MMGKLGFWSGKTEAVNNAYTPLQIKKAMIDLITVEMDAGE